MIGQSGRTKDSPDKQRIMVVHSNGIEYRGAKLYLYESVETYGTKYRWRCSGFGRRYGLTISGEFMATREVRILVQLEITILHL